MLKNNFSKSEFEVGIDEAGRGSIAGPVVASAVILPKGFNNEFLNDSKKLSEKKRLELKTIIENESIDYAVFFVDSKVIDKINILNSTFQAMHGAINNLKVQPNFISVDGNKFILFLSFFAPPHMKNKVPDLPHSSNSIHLMKFYFLISHTPIFPVLPFLIFLK